mmetsp:Transcript_9826/g.27635  ORF Transcript_9826/g.27635 Transcript_9826/m.27635 type:complete len:294 (-) Transcript_9826:96-977(-)
MCAGVPGPRARGLRPIEHAIIDKALAHEEILEQPAQVCVVWPVLEAERAAVVQVGGEDRGVPLAERLDRRGALALHDFVVLLFLRIGLEALPRQLATIEIHQHVAYRLEVVASALLDSQMCVHTRVPGSACQTLAFTVWYVLLGLRVPVLFGQPEVDNVHLIGLLPQANEEVVGLDIAVDEILRMDVLNTVDHLVGQHEDRLQAELAVAETEEILEGRTQQVDDHDVVVALHAVPVDVRDADAASEDLAQLGLVEQLRVPGVDILKLDGDFLASLYVAAEVHVAEGARADLAA